MKNKHLVLLNIILLIIVLIVSHHEGIGDYYKISDDVRSLFYINNLEGLEDNILSKYSYAKLSTTIYLSNLYIFINNFIDFIYITKILPIFIFLLSIFFIYKLGTVIKDKRYALILTLLFILQPFIIRPFHGSLSRSFAFPLLIASIYYLIKKDKFKLSFVFLLEAMMYPVVFLISLFTYGLSLINLKRKSIDLDLKRNYKVFTAIALSFILILIPMLFFNQGITELVSLKESMYSQEFYKGDIPFFKGTIPFTSDIKSTIVSLAETYNPGINQPIYTNALFVLILLTFIFTIIYKKQILKLPKEVYLLLISSLILQSLAFLLFSRLFMPARYVQFSIPLFFMIILAHGLYFLSTNKKFKNIFITLIFLLSIFYVSKLIITPEFNLAHCSDKEMYNYIKTLPNDSLIAGHPPDMNCIALYGQKNPFSMSILNLPYYKEFYQVMIQHDYNFFSAYYASSKKEVQEFCSINGVTHIVVNKEHFNKGFYEQDRIYSEAFEPFDIPGHIKEITKNKERFYLQNPENVVFSSNNKFIVSCSS